MTYKAQHAPALLKEATFDPAYELLEMLKDGQLESMDIQHRNRIWRQQYLNQQVAIDVVDGLLHRLGSK